MPQAGHGILKSEVGVRYHLYAKINKQKGIISHVSRTCKTHTQKTLRWNDESNAIVAYCVKTETESEVNGQNLIGVPGIIRANVRFSVGGCGGTLV